MNDKRMKQAMARALAAVMALPKPERAPTVKAEVPQEIQNEKMAAAAAKRARRAAKAVK